MKIKARGTIDFPALANLHIPRGKGLLCIQIGEQYRPKMAEQLKALSDRQISLYDKARQKYAETPPEQRGRAPEYYDNLLELELDLTIHFRKRSINANNLYWKILEIEANWINGSFAYRSGYWSKRLPDQVITPQQIHDDDLEVYCEKTQYFVPKASLWGFRRGVE